MSVVQIDREDIQIKEAVEFASDLQLRAANASQVVIQDDLSSVKIPVGTLVVANKNFPLDGYFICDSSGVDISVYPNLKPYLDVEGSSLSEVQVPIGGITVTATDSNPYRDVQLLKSILSVHWPLSSNGNVTFILAEAVSLDAIQIFTSNELTNLKDIKIYGSNDNINFNLIWEKDTVLNMSVDPVCLIVDKTPYKFYKFKSSELFSLGGIKLFSSYVFNEYKYFLPNSDDISWFQGPYKYFIKAI